jgi:purine nucleosidase/pyrimidine-specific ribonucleoside hydrolase
MRALVTASAIHGRNGLGGVCLPEPSAAARQEHAVRILDELSRAYAGELTVIATGPLTNVAAALILDPAFAQRVASLVFMGGAVATQGNVTSVAEFNAYVDPEAVQVVISSGIDYTMVGLDVTERALLHEECLEAFAPDRPVQAAARHMLEFYVAATQRATGMSAAPLHDPLAVGVAAGPGWARLERGRVWVDTGDAETRGRTLFGPSDSGAKKEPVGRVATALEADFAAHFVDVLGAL